jgi:putative aldouronate transport system permease protein
LQYELRKLLDSVSASTGGQQAGTSATASSAATITPVTIRAAATIFTMAPIIALYPFLQRYFVTGLTIGGVKD